MSAITDQKEILKLIDSNDIDIIRDAKEIVHYLDMNKDTVKMFGDILAYCHNCENDEENIEWAADMIHRIQSKFKEKAALHERFSESVKQFVQNQKQ
jgi:hypothetical protein